jgi:hypothetical protein
VTAIVDQSAGAFMANLVKFKEINLVFKIEDYSSAFTINSVFKFLPMVWGRRISRVNLSQCSLNTELLPLLICSYLRIAVPLSLTNNQ